MYESTIIPGRGHHIVGMNEHGAMRTVYRNVSADEAPRLIAFLEGLGWTNVYAYPESF